MNTPQQLSAFSIDTFCERNDLSRSFFYKMKREGKAPRLMDIGGRTRVSIEAEADWRRQCEAEAAKDGG